MGKFTHFFFDQEAVPSLYTDSMNLVHQQWGDLSQSINEVTTNWDKEKTKKKDQPLVLRDIGLGME